jgi:hypothetical protein
MLHRWSILLSLGLAAMLAAAGGLATTAYAQNAQLRAPMTAKARAALAEKIRPQLVEVQRISPPPRNIVIPGHGPDNGLGWWAASGRVLTASILVQDWPRSEEDFIRVRRPGGKWRPATVGLTDVRLGIAMLDVASAPADPPPPPVEPPKKGTIFGGRMVYTAARPQPKSAPQIDAGLINVLIAGAAAPPWGYYWLVGGPVEIGTPLFDVRGRLVTLIGLRRPTGETLALPTRALEALYERRIDWAP